MTTLVARTSFLLLASLAACTTAGDAPPTPSLTGAISVRDLGVVSVHSAISGRDVGQSTWLEDRSVWVFGDTPLLEPGADGSTWRSSTAAHVQGSPLEAGFALTDLVDEVGVPREFLPFTAAEASFNAERASETCDSDCGARVRLWPGPIVSDPLTGDALVFYTKLIARPGDFNFESLGSSIARWRSVDEPVARPQVAPGSEDPTLLWSADVDVELSSAAVVARDYLYAYGCEVQGIFEVSCVVGRAPIAEPTSAASWELFAGDASWVSDSRSAISVIQGNPIMSVHWNEYLDRFLAIYVDAPSNSVLMQTASAPEGPWSDPLFLFEARAPSDEGAWIYDVVAHEELADEQGRTIFLTYNRGTGFLASELRRVAVTFL